MIGVRIYVCYFLHHLMFSYTFLQGLLFVVLATLVTAPGLLRAQQLRKWWVFAVQLWIALSPCASQQRILSKLMEFRESQKRK